MKRVKQRGYDFSAGIVIAACLLGAAEGIYRDVSMLYAASLYGSLALFSIPVGSVLRRILPIKGGLFKWGMSLGLSVRERRLYFSQNEVSKLGKSPASGLC